MKKIERILATLHHEWTDQVPKGEFHVEDEFVTKLLGLKENVQFQDRVGMIWDGLVKKIGLKKLRNYWLLHQVGVAISLAVAPGS